MVLAVQENNISVKLAFHYFAMYDDMNYKWSWNNFCLNIFELK